MAINNQKFLPPSKSVALVKRKTTNISKFLAPNKSVSLVDDTEIIKVKAIEVDKLLRNNLLLKAKEIKDDKREKENEERQKEEDKLERKNVNSKDPKEIIPNIPKIGFLESIKRFLYWTFLGYAFTKFNKYLPQFVELGKKLIPVANFIGDLTGNVLNSLGDFLVKGYEAADATRGFLKDIGGNNTVKLFDKFSKSLNDFINAAIVFGALATKKRTPMGGLGGSGGKIGFDVTGRRVSRKVQARYLERFGERTFIKRFGTKNLKSVVTKTFGKQASRLVGKSLDGIPIVGGLVDFVINLIMGENPGRAAARAVGSSVGSALGSFIPIPFAGTILGGILGDVVGGALYDTLVNGNKKTQARAQGGSITRKGSSVGGRVGRTIKKTPRGSVRVPRQQTVPGKDVGGIKEIIKLYGDDTNPQSRSSLRALKNTSSSLKKIPLFGNLMGASIDIALGQRPDKNIFKSVANSFGSFIQGVIDNNITSTLGDVMHTIAGLAEGGVVPRTIMENQNTGFTLGLMISKVFSTMLDTRVNEIFRSLRKEMGLAGEGPLVPGPEGGELTKGSIPRGQITMDQLVGLAKGAGFNQSDAVIMAAIAMAESGGDSNAHNNRPPDDSYGLWQVNMIGNLGPARRKQFGIGTDDELKDPVVNVNAAKLIKQSQGFKAWSVYSSGAYRKFLPAAQQSASSPSITVYKASTLSGGFIPLGAGYGNLQTAQKLASSMGLTMTSFNTGKHAEGSLHYQNRAMDFSNDSVGAGTPEQLKFAQTLVQQYGKTAAEIFYTPLGYSIKNGKVVELIDPSNHYNHVHVAFGRGGRVNRPTFALIGERGREFIFDSDTTSGLDRIAPGLLDKLNVAKTKPQLENILQSYTEYEQPEIIVMIQPIEKIVTKTVSHPLSAVPHANVVNKTIPVPAELMIS